MRWYEIVIKFKDGSVYQPPSMKGLKLRKGVSYGSVDNQGNALTSALHIQLNVPVNEIGAIEADDGVMLHIFNVGIEDIAKGNTLTDAYIEVRGGMMQPGLPLAVPKKPSVLVSGSIWSAFGNWVGTQTEMCIIISDPLQGMADQKPDITFNWPDGTPLADAIEQMMTAAFPEYEISIAISDQLKVKGQQVGFYGTFNQFSMQITQFSKDKQFRGIKTLDGSPYDGVKIVKDPAANKITVSDGTQKANQWTKDRPHQIDFIDLIGQPTWIEPEVITFATVLRGDIRLGDYVKLPAGLKLPYVTTTDRGAPNPVGVGAEQDPSRNNVALKGTFLIVSIEHYMMFRQPDANSWVTIFQGEAEMQQKVGDGTTSISGGAEATTPSLIEQAFNAPTGTTVTDPKIVAAFNQGTITAKPGINASVAAGAGVDPKKPDPIEPKNPTPAVWPG
jgi:hypothetical protein